MSNPTKWKSQFDTLESLRLEILQLTEGIDNEILKKKPSDAEWSVIEICNHLMVIEQLSIGYIRNKIEKADQAKPVNFQSKLKGWILRIALSLPLRFKAPKAVSQIPAPKTFADLSMIWDMTRKELWKVIEKVPEGSYNKAFFKHPISGYMTIEDMLDFFIVHTKHHIKQIKRTLQKVKAS
ncbi:MAG: PadR family transcriptional regulator [Bacteroidia bacterium]|nr:MAG: PadR family transcriptional regulator [Bacteroidia bacterium]